MRTKADVVEQGIDRSVFSGVDKRFAAVLLVSLVANFSWAAVLNRLPRRPQTEELFDPGFKVSPLMRLPKTPQKVVVSTAPMRTGPATASKPSVSSTGASTKVQTTGLLGVISALGGAGLLEGVAPTDVNVHEALEGAGSRQLGTDLGVTTAHEGQGSKVASIGALGTDGVKDVQFVTREPVKAPKALIDFEPPTDGPADAPQVMKFIAKRRGALQACYERELKRNGGLKGRLLVRLTLAAEGRPEHVEVDDETLGSDEVASCLRTVISRWEFPQVASSPTMSIPFVFAPTN